MEHTNGSSSRALPSVVAHDDVEKSAESDYAHLTNTAVTSFSWSGVTVTVPDRQTKQPRTILSDVNGILKAGESHLIPVSYPEPYHACRLCGQAPDRTTEHYSTDSVVVAARVHRNC